MDFRSLLLILFGLFALYGVGWSVVTMRRMRARRDYKGTLLEWGERPTIGFGLAGLRYEGGSWVAIVLHGLSVVAVGTAAGLVLFTRPLKPLFSWGLLGLFIIPAVAMMVALAGYWWGTAIAHPLADLFGGERHMAVSSEGILLLGMLFPWDTFSRFSLVAEGAVVRLWSASFPGLIGLVLNPPQEQWAALLQTLQGHIPGETAEAPNDLLAQCAFPALMAVVCGPLVLGAWLLVLAPAELALTADGCLMLLLMLIGGPGLLRVSYGGKNRPAPIEGDNESPVQRGQEVQ